MRGKIFLDFDDTMFHTQPAIFKYIEDAHGVSLEQNKWHCGNSMVEIINNHVGFELVEFNSFWKDYADNFLTSIERHGSVLPIPNMVEILGELAEKYELYIVTARQKIGINVIQFLVNKYIPKHIKDIHCVWDRTNSGFLHIPKHEYVAAHKGKKIAFIDDNPGEVAKMNDVVPSFLFDPNELHTNTNHQKFSSWKEIKSKFL